MNWVMTVGGVAILVLVAGCGQSGSKPVPIGERGALERLADSYRQASDEFTIRISQLPPEKRKDFVKRVFKDSGYDYSASLHALATTEWSTDDQLAVDLVDLVLLPHSQAREVDMNSLYSGQELKDIREVENRLR